MTFKSPNLKRVNARSVRAHKVLRVKISGETRKCAPRFTSSKWMKIGKNSECKVLGRNSKSEKFFFSSNERMRFVRKELNFPINV